MTDSSTIVLCPGQGAQYVGMGRDWARTYEAAAETFRHADEVLNLDVSRACFDGPQERIDDTDVAQVCIYVTSVACVRALEQMGRYDEETLVATAGLSLGEYTALYLAGVFDFEDGLHLVSLRGHFMQDAAEQSNSGMVAIIGSDEEQVNELCDAARGKDVLVPANFNCPGQIVISGSDAACTRAVAEAEKRGMRATALNVAGAFHSPLMDSAAERMANALRHISFNAPRVPVLSNVTGEPHSDDGEAIKELLIQQITQPVRWEQNLRWLLEHAEGEYIEPAPGKTLRGHMRRIDRQVKVTGYDQPPDN